ncbi:MAG TPA: hypothetical protein VJG29_01825 [Candidatus Paceibacterota bacterium]
MKEATRAPRLTSGGAVFVNLLKIRYAYRMDEDDFERLEKLVEENNRILKRIQGWMRMSRLLSGLYWLVIIGAGFGAFYYVQPLLAPFVETGKGVFENIKEVQEGLNKSALDIPGVFEKIQGQ